ncbi:MAG: putative PEP-binding protein, partial [Candidatus Omnitrophota bacterium]
DTSVVEKYLVDSGKNKGSPLIASYDPKVDKKEVKEVETRYALIELYRAKGLTTEEIKLKVQKRINFLNEHEDLEQVLHKQNPRIHISNDEIFAIQAARLAEVRIPVSVNGVAKNLELWAVVLRGKGLDVEKIMVLRVLMNLEFLLQYLKRAVEDKNGVFAALKHLKLIRFKEPLTNLLEKLVAKAIELNYNGETLDSLIGILSSKERKMLSRKIINGRSLLDIVKQCITDPFSIPLADIGMISEEQKAAETQRRISAVKAVMETIIRKLEKNDPAGILDSYRCFYDDLTKEKIDVSNSQKINEKEYQGKWSEAFILDMIDVLGKTAARLEDDSSIKHALIEVVRSLKDILWELLFSCDYATDLIREEVKKEVDKRFSELKKQIDNSLSALNENKESFKLVSGKMAKGEELLDMFNAIIEEFLRNASLNLERIMQGQARHLSYRHLLLEEAINDTLNQVECLGTLEKMADLGYREFLKGESEGAIQDYLRVEIRRYLEAVADYLITRIEIDLHIEHKQDKDIVLVADYLITSFEYDNLIEFFGGRLKCIIDIFGGHCIYSAKADGLPFFVLKNKDLRHFRDGQPVLILNGAIVISPCRETRGVFAAEVKQREALDKYYNGVAQKLTEKGEFPVSINGDSPRQIKEAPYANGIELVRTENFLRDIFFPGLRMMAAFYRGILEAAGGKAVKFRFHDDQLDKRPQVLSFLRYKGNKFYLEHPLGIALTNLSIKSLLICRGYYGFSNFEAMAPMIEEEGELILVKELLETAKAEIGTEGDVFGIGTMVETKLAADNLMVIIKTKIAKFFSIGTNDLIRFLYAIPRNDPRIYHMYYELVRPLVLKKIMDIVAQAQAAGIKVSICGDLASIREFWLVRYYFKARGFDIMLSMPKPLTKDYKTWMFILDSHKEEFTDVFDYLDKMLGVSEEKIDGHIDELNKILQAAAKKIEGFAKEAASDSARRLPGVTAQEEAAAENIRINNQWDALKELDFALFESKMQKALKPFRWLFGNHRVDAFIDYIKVAGRIRAGPSDKIYGAYIVGKGLFLNQSLLHNSKELIKTIIHEFGAYLGLPHGVNTLLEFFFQPVRCPVYFSYILYTSILELKDTINGFIRKPIKAVYLFFLGLMMVVQFSSIKFASVDFAAAWGFAPLAQAEEIKKPNFTLSSLSGAELSAAYSEVKEENKRTGEKAEPKEAPVAVQASSTKTDSGAAKEAVDVEEPKVEAKVELPKEEVAAKKTEAPVMTTGPPAGNRGYVLGQPKAENSILKALEEGKTAYRKGNNAEAKEKLNTVINAE